MSKEKTQIIKKIKQDIMAGEYKKAFLALNVISDQSDDFVMQTRYADLFNSIAHNLHELKKIRVAILASSTVTHFKDILKYWLAKDGFMADIYESEYNTIAQTILDTDSPLYAFKPEITIIFTNYRDVKFNNAPNSSFAEIRKSIQTTIESYVSLWETLHRNSNCHIIQNNADLPYHRVFSNYEGSALWGYINMLRSFNLELAKAAQAGVTIFDIDFISSAYGKKRWHDMRYWYHSKHAFTPDATGLVAYNAAKVIGSIKGSAKKCLVLDLDNTLWGGVIGDDGLKGIELGDGPAGEAFCDFQKFLIKLKERGVMLAVCSKNDEDTAKEPFLSHPNMHIKLDDIAVFKADWNDKVRNIKEIAGILNIDLDSIVFVDDNPAERELVRTFLPMVSVPDMSEDPSGYVSALSSYAYFETVSFSEEDKKRGEYYRIDKSRSKFQKQFTDLSQYLQNLKMKAIVGNFDNLNLTRIAQLINKTNQFNLTTIRYTEKEIRSMMASKDMFCRFFKLEDCFGDNGLIAAVILKKTDKETLYIDTWVMSCRVLSRGMEEFIYQDIADIARRIGYKKVVGRYSPTAKNNLVRGLYGRLGFSMVSHEDSSDIWECDVTGDLPSHTLFIERCMA